MNTLPWVVTVALAVAIAVVLWKLRTKSAELSKARAALVAVHAQNASLKATADALRPYQAIVDAAAEAARIQEQAKQEAAAIIAQAKNTATRTQTEGEAVLQSAQRRADGIVAAAEVEAQRIAGDALRALAEADRLQSTVVAMRNAIEGYGDRYLVPSHTLLDTMAEDYSFDKAGQDLKAAREATRRLFKSGAAADCDYVEANRKATAVAFVLDAFNGKVDSLLAGVKSENFGTLSQKVRDAYALVNHLGTAFRRARIAPEYLAHRLEEFRYASAVAALREREREEQKQIREQIREEEKARREIERALKDAQKEEDTLERALKKAQEHVARANDATRAEFEARLATLEAQLVEARSKNQRALSMAQQTKAGHVYVISNVGAFGEDVVKVGMTRRLEPTDRIRELGDASVPFSFDVHALLWSDDAPALEHVLHKRFLTAQVNKVNPRKEFFRIPVAALKATVEELGLDATWTLRAAATEYRETLAIEEALRQKSVEAARWIQAQLAVPEPALVVERDGDSVATATVA